MSRQPTSTADSGQTAELIAQHAALLPLWLNFVDGRRAEQQKIQLAMRTHAAPAGAVVEAPAPPPVPAAAAPKEPVPTDPNPVAWLMEAPAKAPGTPFDPPADDPFAPPASAVTPDATDVPPSAASGAGAGMDDSDDSGASVTLFDPSASAAIAADMDEGSESSTGGPEWLRLVEGDFGGDVSQEFGGALAETDQAQLPHHLQQAMRYGQEPEEIAAAFVRSARAGELPERLGAAVERMEEVDFHFRDVGQRLDSPTPDDDPNGWF